MRVEAMTKEVKEWLGVDVLPVPLTAADMAEVYVYTLVWK